ncbi:MAG: class SAM-dependent methyltransferase [Segetibacter sp.]|nr:class SAM-dependent methyltransferase [Segetibacter sp.]
MCTDFTVSQEQFEVWKCSTCTFRFTQNVPAAAYIGPYYRSAEYVSHSDTKEGFVNRLYHIVRSFTLQTKRTLVKKVTGLKQGVLLDIGAGTGAFSNKMQQGGWNVTGLEPDEFAREKALSKYDLKLEKLTNLENLVGETFDAITLWHVLEHVHDLHGYLEKFLEILKPTGRLVIGVPNYTSYDAGFYKDCWAAYDVPRHLYHFSPKSMQVLLEKKGFLLEAVKPMWFDSFYVSMLSEKYRQGKDNFFRAVWIGLVSNMKALFDTKRCSSVIYIIRKK